MSQAAKKDELPPVPGEATPRAPVPRLAERRAPSLGFLLSLGLGLVVVLICLGCGAFALRNFKQEKMRDTLAIMYLELERTALGIERQAQALVASVDAAKPPDVVVRLASETNLEPVRGRLPKGSLVRSTVADAVRDPREALLLQFGGEDYLGRFGSAREAATRLGEPVPEGRYLMLWRTNVAEWVGSAAGKASATSLYLLTREGAVLYSNHPDVGAATYLKRTLVQRFIDAPLKVGQLAFKDDKTGEDSYGFFFEVPTTNVIAFAEAPSSVALAPVRSALLRFVLVMLASLAVALILLQLFLGVVTAPIARLMALTRQVAAGVFDVDVGSGGFREIKELAVCFRDMSGSLKSRDERIQELMAEQVSKVRLESEIELARTVQTNLLPKAALSQDSGLDLAIHYLPMTELAGDWYGYAVSKDGSETTVALADISGHGAGSAMFMTLIAGAFEELRVQGNGAPAPAAFVEKTHGLIRAVGNGAWHATIVAFKFQRATGEIHIVGAGHPFPVLSSTVEGKRTSEYIRLPSTIVGGVEFKYAEARVKLDRGMALAIYSDGLVEAEDAEGRRFGAKRLREVFRREGSAQGLVNYTVKQLQAHVKGNEANDDCCLLVARAI